MATLTIRNLPDDVRDKLRVHAARHGRSMEAEARELLAQAVERGEMLDGSSRRERLRRAQEAVARYVSPGSYSVDRFLSERREEAAADEEKWHRLQREADEERQRSARGSRNG